MFLTEYDQEKVLERGKKEAEKIGAAEFWGAVPEKDGHNT